MKTIEDLKEIADWKNHRSFLFNVNLVQTEDGDVLLDGDAGEEVRLARKIVAAHNKDVREGKIEDKQYRIGLQGRLGPDNPHKDLYKNQYSTRIKLKHAAYAGVYLWQKSLQKIQKKTTPKTIELGTYIMAKIYTIIMTNNRRGTDYDPIIGTIDELNQHFKYTLEKGASWEHEKGNKKINTNPRSGKMLVKNLNNAENNAAGNGYSQISFRLEE